MNNNITVNKEKPYSIDNLARKSKETALEMLKDTLEALDESILNHSERKKNYYVKGIYKRTITTLYGTITFKRRLYINKSTGEYESLLDRLVGIDPYSRLSDEAIIAITDAALECNSYRIAGMYAISGTIVSRQTVYNCLEKVDFIRTKNKEKISSDCIHISVDGFFANYKEFQRKTETKFANIYTGIENETSKRKRLINKTIINQTNGKNFKEELLSTLNQYYKIDDNTKIYLCGDGAQWIKYIYDDIPNSVFVIDKFHYKRALKSLPNPQEAYKAIEMQNIELLANQYSLCTTNLQLSNLQYVIANFEYTKHWKEPDFICCAAENVVSHVYNHRIRGIPRNWGRNLYKISLGLALKTTGSLNIELSEISDEKLLNKNKKMKICLYHLKLTNIKINFRYLNIKEQGLLYLLRRFYIKSKSIYSNFHLLYLYVCII